MVATQMAAKKHPKVTSKMQGVAGSPAHASESQRRGAARQGHGCCAGLCAVLR